MTENTRRTTEAQAQLDFSAAAAATLYTEALLHWREAVHAAKLVSSEDEELFKTLSTTVDLETALGALKTAEFEPEIIAEYKMRRAEVNVLNTNICKARAKVREADDLAKSTALAARTQNQVACEAAFKLLIKAIRGQWAALDTAGLRDISLNTLDFEAVTLDALLLKANISRKRARDDGNDLHDDVNDLHALICKARAELEQAEILYSDAWDRRRADSAELNWPWCDAYIKLTTT